MPSTVEWPGRAHGGEVWGWELSKPGSLWLLAAVIQEWTSPAGQAQGRPRPQWDSCDYAAGSGSWAPGPARGSLCSLWERLRQSAAVSTEEGLSFIYLIQAIL